MPTGQLGIRGKHRCNPKFANFEYSSIQKRAKNCAYLHVMISPSNESLSLIHFDFDRFFVLPGQLPLDRMPSPLHKLPVIAKERAKQLSFFSVNVVVGKGVFVAWFLSLASCQQPGELEKDREQHVVSLVRRFLLGQRPRF